MKLFLSYIRLIRPFNLIIIVITLYMVRLSMASPPFFIFLNRPLQISEPIYLLFSLSFVFIAAAGYVINDYYDMEIDKINKPRKAIVGSTLSSRSALNFYWVLNISGIVAGFYSVYCAGVPLLGVLFLFYSGGLWLYSFKLKSTFLWGNLLIAFFIGLVPLAGACIELFAPLQSSKDYINDIWTIDLNKVCIFTGGVSLFAFLSTLLREIVKDVEDIEGDTIADCRTIPIVIGIQKTKRLLVILLVILNILLGCAQYQVRTSGIYPLIYFLVFIQVPFLIILYKLQKASSANNFHSISTWLKTLMVTYIFFVFAGIFESYFITEMYNAIAR